MDPTIRQALEEARASKKLKLNSVSVDKEVWDAITAISDLQVLSLVNCGIGNLPAKIKSMQELQDVNLSVNHFNFFPMELLHLSKLTRLNSGNNNIKQVPPEINALTEIEDIDLSENKIEEIPNEFGDLTKLKNLNLSDNKIKRIPNVLKSLSSLEKLSIKGNPVQNVLNVLDLHAIQVHFSEEQLDNLFQALEKSSSAESTPFYPLRFYYKIMHKEYISSIRELFLNVAANDTNKLLKDLENIGYGILKGYNDPYGFLFLKKHNHIVYLAEDNEYGDPKIAFFQLGILIYGTKEAYKAILRELMQCIESWMHNKKQGVEKQEANEKEKKHSVSVKRNGETGKRYRRFFYYPKENTEIDYDKLMKYSLSGENLYFDDVTGKKIPVGELLSFIGADTMQPTKSWRGKDYITHVKIEHFKLFSQIEFPLSDRINIVLGRNALGKTAILQAITLGLLPVENQDKSNEFQDFIQFGKKQAEITLNWGSEEYRKAFVFRNELNEEQPVYPPQKLLLAYGVNLNTSMKLDHTDIVEDIINGNAAPYSTRSVFMDYSTDFYDPLILLDRLQLRERKNAQSDIRKVSRLIMNTINRYLQLVEADERMALKYKDRDYFFEDINSNKLKTQHLSEGYRDHVLLLTDIIIRILAARNRLFEKAPPLNDLFFQQAHGVILIDEFDRHLHPFWQRRFLLQLKKDFLNIQFVLTTHNMLALQSAEGFTALVITTANKEISVTKRYIKPGLSIESIYNIYFQGNNKFYSEETENLFNKFYRLLEKVETEEATNDEIKDFKQAANKLLHKDEEVVAIVTRELNQMYRLTGKTVDL